MTFLELYGAALDLELGTSDTVLFTVARRKLAINDAVTAWIRDTGITKRISSFSLVTGTSLYNLDLLAGFTHLDGPPYIKVVTGSTTRYIQGPTELPRIGPIDLDREFPGWDAAPSGTPTAWFEKFDGGNHYIGVTPAPLTTGSTWTLYVRYVSNPPAVMSADADIPLTFTGPLPVYSFVPFHQALVHYAASKLERLRKNYDGAKMQMAEYNNYVNKWFTEVQRDSNPQIQMAHNYYQSRGRVDDWRT